MSHDKIRAAARKRMAETGEPYATARREVIKEHQQATSQSRHPGTGGSRSATARPGSTESRPGWTPFSAGVRDDRVWRLAPTRSGADGRFQAERPVQFDAVGGPVSGSALGTTGVHAGRGWLLVTRS